MQPDKTLYAKPLARFEYLHVQHGHHRLHSTTQQCPIEQIQAMHLIKALSPPEMAHLWVYYSWSSYFNCRMLWLNTLGQDCFLLS